VHDYNKLDKAPPKGPVPHGKSRICIAGYSISPHYVRANNVAALLLDQFPHEFEAWSHGTTRDEYFLWLVGFKDSLPSFSPFQTHNTSPICWLEKDDGTVEVFGGRDRFVEWTAKNYAGSRADKKSESIVSPFESLVQIPPLKGRVPAGIIRLCVAGYGISPNYTRARNVAVLLSKQFPDQYEFWTFGPSRDEYFDWLSTWKNSTLNDPTSAWQSHATAPICWLEKDDGSIQIIGGRDRLVEWTAAAHAGSRADEQGKKILNPFEQNM